jgi:ribosomal protein L7/L12
MQTEEELKTRVARLERQVEFLLRHLGLPERVGEPQAVAGEVLALKRAGRTIEAIKLYREATCLGLAEAKDYVDRLY